jgi:hypothetical protein
MLNTTRLRCALAAVCLSAATAAAIAPDSLDMRYSGNWPFGPCYAVACDAARRMVYLSAGGGVFCLDVTVRAAPRLLSDRLRTRGHAEGLAMADSRAGTPLLFVADGPSGLEVWRTADSTTPELAGVFRATGTVTAVAVADTLAFLADADSGLRVLSVASPSSPTQLGLCPAAQRGRAVALRDTCAFVACWPGGLCVVSTADPRSPRQLAALTQYTKAVAVAVVDTVAWVVDCDSGLFSVSVAVPDSPRQLGRLPRPSATYNMFGLAVRGQRAYVTASYDGVYVIDIADPANPTLVARGTGTGMAYGVCVDNAAAYVAEMWQGLAVLNTTVAGNPPRTGAYSFAPGGVQCVQVSAPRAYLSNAAAGLQVLDASDPSSILVLAGMPGVGYSYGLCTRDTLAYVAGGWSGVAVVSIADPAHPLALSQCSPRYCANHTAVRDTLLCVADRDSGVAVMSVADPRHPRLLGGCSVPGSVYRVIVQDSFAYAATDRAGLRVVSLADPAHPLEVSSWGTGAVSDLALAGHYLYASAGSSVAAVDVTDPRSPAAVGTFSITRGAQALALSNGYLYCAGDGVWAYALGNGTTATPVGHYRSGLQFIAIGVDGPWVMAGTQLSGLQMYQHLAITTGAAGGPSATARSARAEPVALRVARAGTNLRVCVAGAVPPPTRCDIYASNGALVAALAAAPGSAGSYSFAWARRSAGLYVVRLRCAGRVVATATVAARD